MHIDRDRALASAIAPLEIDIERWRLRLFAKAIGETDPVYSDLDAARAAGYPDLPAPPSFLGESVELDGAGPLGWLAALGADSDRATQVAQSFEFHAMAFAGDSLTLRRRIADVFADTDGARDFVVKETQVRRGAETLATARCTYAVPRRGDAS